MRDYYPLEFVDRVSSAQLQVGEDLGEMTWGVKGYLGQKIHLFPITQPTLFEPILKPLILASLKSQPRTTRR